MNDEPIGRVVALSAEELLLLEIWRFMVPEEKQAALKVVRSATLRHLRVKLSAILGEDT